jgi:antitoxin component of MazEF toxin-antitoxin module
MYNFGGSMTVIVKKLGGSVAVVIPMALARQMGLSDGTPLDISTNNDAIIMRKAGRRPRRPRSKIVGQIDSASYRRHNREFAKDAPVGKEFW